MRTRPSRFTLLAGMAMLATAAGAAPRERATRAEIFAAPAYDALKFSPDGRQIAMLRPTNGVPNVWVAPVADFAKAVPVTHFTDRGADGFRWASDGRFILVEKDVAGEEDTQIHAVDLQTKAIRDLTANPAVQAHILKTSAKLPGKALISLNDRDPKYSDVYLIDLASGQRTLVLRNDRHYTSFVADKDLHVRIVGRVNPADGSTTYFDMAGATPRAFFSIPLAALRSSRVLGLTDHGTLRMLNGNDTDLAGVVDIDIATGQVAPLAQANEADIVDVVTDDKTGAILATAEDPLVTRWTARSPDAQPDLDTLAAKLGAGFQIDDETDGGKLWLVRQMPGHGPARYFLWKRDTRSLSMLASTHPALEQRVLPTTLPIMFRSRDGLRITGYLTLPPGLALEGGRLMSPVPLVINVHGGPWLRDSYEFDPANVWLAEQGYAALSVNFRGSSGFGKHFMQIADRQWSKTMHDDLLDAVQWAIGQNIASKDKVAIWGLSYGGYSTLVGLSFTPDVFRCGVDIAGPSNLTALQADAPDWWAWQRSQFALRMGDGSTAQGKQDLADRSPITHVAQVKSPLLIAQGLNDPRVRPAQSSSMAEAVRAHGTPVTLLLYPDEGHVFEKAATDISFHAVAEHFLAQCLGGTARPYGKDLIGSGMQVRMGAQYVPGLGAALTGAKAGR
ncbi:S9 family peptidase [Sphingomonas oryzagri]